MKILHIINNLSKGGAEKLLSLLLPKLNKINNLEIDVLLITDEGSIKLYKDLISQSGIKIHQLNCGLYEFLKVASKLFKFFEANKFDIIHVHLFPCFYYIPFVQCFSKVKTKLFFTEHSTKNKRSNSFFGRKVDWFFYSRYDKVVAIGDAVKSALIARGINEKKIIVIENGIDLSLYKKIVKNDYLFKIGMVGRLNSPKNQKVIIKALKFLPQNIVLLLAGDGKEKNVLSDLAMDLGLQDRVVFLGFIDDVNLFFKKIDIHILSSKWEGFGLSAVESMACGIPTIASDVPGLSNVVFDGGILFKENDENDLAQKIKDLYGNRNYYNEIQKSCIQKAALFDLDETATKYKGLYNSLFN